MFHRTITELLPWTERDMFENVVGGAYRPQNSGENDRVMSITLKALLSRRLPEGVTFEANAIQIFNTDDPIAALNNVAEVITGGNSTTISDLKYRFIVAYFDGMQEEEAKDFIDLTKTKVLEIPGFTIHAKQDMFLNQYMRLVALINEENATCIIVTPKPTIDHWHLMASMIPAYFSALFKEKELEQDEKEMLHALTMHGSQTWTAKISSLEKYYGIREMRIQKLIGGFAARERESQKSRIDDEIRNITERMNSLMRQYRDLCQQKDDANIRRNGIVYAIDSEGDDNELVKFFQANKSLDVQSVTGSTITFIVKTYLESFGADGSDFYEDIHNSDRFFEENCPRGDNVFSSTENRRKFLDALIIGRKFKLLMCAVYNLNIMGSVGTNGGYEFPNNCADYYPNYHLNHHECFGDYRRVICDYLNRGDTIGAINACIASAKSINVEESGATFNPMMKEIFGTSKKCIELPDGTHVTPAKALEWLNEQEGNGDENE